MSRLVAFDLGAFFPQRLSRLAEIVSRDFVRTYRDKYDISFAEWTALLHVGGSGETTATEIVRKSEMHKTKVSRAVGSLQERGWVARNASRADKRIEILSLTREGKEIFADLTAIAHNFESKLFGTLAAGEAEHIRNAIRALETELGLNG